MAGTTQMPTPETALPGREQALAIENRHYVLDSPLLPPFPENSEKLLLGMGCFWGAERRLWQQEGVFTTAVGYAGGYTLNPTYQEVCTGMTAHTEVVLVVYRGGNATLTHLLKEFWEAHDPTQGMRQGNDIGTQYRSAIYTFGDEQEALARSTMQNYQHHLRDAGHGTISTELRADVPFFYAEDYHQQYLAKNPNGYCGLGGTGVCFPPA